MSLFLSSWCLVRILPFSVSNSTCSMPATTKIVYSSRQLFVINSLKTTVEFASVADTVWRTHSLASALCVCSSTVFVLDAGAVVNIDSFLTTGKFAIRKFLLTLLGALLSSWEHEHNYYGMELQYGSSIPVDLFLFCLFFFLEHVERHSTSASIDNYL